MRSLFFGIKNHRKKEKPMSEINWFPGHMAKTLRLLEDQIRSVDAVIELCDARAPYATRNPLLMKLIGQKQHLLVLNKVDLADKAVTGAWLTYFSKIGVKAVKYKSIGGKPREIFKLIEEAVRDKVEHMKMRGAMKTVRVMVVGIPNVGKSTFINALKGQAIAKTADRPGVTRSNQWVKINPFLDLLDTPGMLWPRLDDQKTALRLAFLGSIRDEIMDSEQLAKELLKELSVIAPKELAARYKLEESDLNMEPNALLESCCRHRGFLLSGGRYDTLRCAQIVLDEFRSAKIGRITLERVGGVL